MVKDYIVNAAVLVAFLSIVFQFFRSSGISPSSPLKFRVLWGGIFGLLGVMLMFFSINLPNNMIIDFRYLSIILSATIGGWISCAVSGTIVSIFRLLLYGINKASITAVILILVLTAFYCIFVQLKIKKQWMWISSVGITQIVTSVAFSIIIDDPKLKSQVILSFCVGLAIVSFLLYFYVVYMEALTEAYRLLKQEAHRDFLTGLNNVRQFDVMFNHVINNVKISEKRVSLLYIDIDFFKKVNDTYGHKEGDVVLKRLGEILTKMCRNIDIVSRNGGEEFSVILIDCAAEMAVEIAERIRKNVENNPIQLSDKTKVNITVSVGIASYPDPINDLEVLREKADEALYEAKRKGRNKVVLSQ